MLTPSAIPTANTAVRLKVAWLPEVLSARATPPRTSGTVTAVIASGSLTATPHDKAERSAGGWVAGVILRPDAALVAVEMAAREGRIARVSYQYPRPPDQGQYVGHHRSLGRPVAHSVRNSAAVGVRPAMRLGMTETTMASTSAPKDTKMICAAGSVGSGTT
jgi:hypothetical protein